MTQKEKVCRNCRLFVKGDKCPLCSESRFSRTWKGIVFIKDVNESEVAKLMGLKAPGKYCIWAK
jgi:RNA polymerase subunit RPABC4/transcription elongation factor Spt4